MTVAPDHAAQVPLDGRHVLKFSLWLDLDRLHLSSENRCHYFDGHVCHVFNRHDRTGMSCPRIWSEQEEKVGEACAGRAVVGSGSAQLVFSPVLAQGLSAATNDGEGQVLSVSSEARSENNDVSRESPMRGHNFARVDAEDVASDEMNVGPV